MADNNSQNTSSTNSQYSTVTPPVNNPIWTTVNTSTTVNVERLEIRKSKDFDRIVKKAS